MSVISAFRRFGMAASLLAVASCGGNPISPPPPPPPPQPDPVSISCPATIELNSPDGSPVAVPFDVPSGKGAAPVATSCAPASDSRFSVGTTTVTCTATDALNRTATCSFNVKITGPPRLTHTQFLAFGDSITWGVDSPPAGLLASPPYAYPFTLEIRLRARYRSQLPLASVINDGLPGEYAASPNADAGSPGGASRFRTALSYYRPTVALLMEGTNDVSIYGQAGADDAIAALRTMIQTAKSQGVRVCLATIPPQRPGFRRVNAALVDPFNVRVRALAAAEQVVLVDVYNALKDNLPIYIGIDDLHPTIAGFEKISETFFEAIKTNFEQQPAAPPSDAWMRFR